MTAGGFRDAQGRRILLPPPSDGDDEAIAAFRTQLNSRLAPEAVLERIRRHTALIAEGRLVADG